MNIRPIELLESGESFGERPGQVLPQPNSIFVTSPNCGQRYSLKIPPFTWDAGTKSIGPASVGLYAPECGWHGHVHSGEWRGDIPRKAAPNSKCFGPREAT